jgi:phosphate:Na+ symporter
VSASILLAIGGLGLFLLGMLILTEGLKGLSGNALRQWLARATTSATTGAGAGALTTAIIQSSSATTVTAVGFVGAGLLTFTQALGIIFGANIGTTVTGWLVAVLGFKLDLGTFVLPLLLVGALLRMFAPGRWAQFGWALAGFSLLFLGIETMQRGMSAFEGMVTPSDFPDDSLFGRVQLVLIGAAITLVTQSSSAGVATALVALASGVISFPQAAAMIIGMDVGTTCTAALATLGGSTAMRQTGFAHVIYNLMTGVMAFLLLTPVALFYGDWVNADEGNAQIGLVAFHSFFNALGVLLVLPFADAFARLIEKLVPEKGPPLVKRLDTRLLGDANASCDAATATLKDIAGGTVTLLSSLLGGVVSGRDARAEISRLTQALEQTRAFVEKMRTGPSNPVAFQRHQSAIHIIDHLSRLLHRCGQDARIGQLHGDHRLQRLARTLRHELMNFTALDDGAAADTRLERLDKLRSMLRDQRRLYRARIIAAASETGAEPEHTLARLDSLRWLHRIGYHLWRIGVHLRQAVPEPQTQHQPS